MRTIWRVRKEFWSQAQNVGGSNLGDGVRVHTSANGRRLEDVA